MKDSPAKSPWPATRSWTIVDYYLRRTPSVRDVVVSGGDVANIPIKRLEDFVTQLVQIENVRDVRLATKGLMGIPQHFLQDDVLAGFYVKEDGRYRSWEFTEAGTGVAAAIRVGQ